MAFVIHDGHYRFTRVPYGLASVPSAFQRMMSQILAGQDGVQCYLDDIIVYGDNPELHEKTTSVRSTAVAKLWFKA